MWSLRANHGGGYQFRLCLLGAELTEACFQQAPRMRTSIVCTTGGGGALPQESG
jgi:hypothetical protein